MSLELIGMKRHLDDGLRSLCAARLAGSRLLYTDGLDPAVKAALCGSVTRLESILQEAESILPGLLPHIRRVEQEQMQESRPAAT